MRDSPDARRARFSPTHCALLAALAIAIPSHALARQFQQPFLYMDPTITSIYEVGVDLNGDGNMDLLQTNNSSAMTVKLGAGALNFRTVQNLTLSGEFPAIGDVNGDGKPDLVNTTLVKLNNGDGTFGPEHPMLGSGSMVHLQDMNGDGKLDMVAVTT